MELQDKIKVLVAHDCALISAGLVALLSRMPGCEARVLEPRAASEPICDDACDETHSAQIVFADSGVVSQMLRARLERRRARHPKLVLLSSVEDVPSRALPSMPAGVDELLSVECGEAELFETVGRLRSQPGQPGLPPRVLAQVLELIRSRIAGAIEMDDLARTAELSVGHFARAFKRSVGVPPYRYLLNLRIQEAARLICETGRTITEVALDVGFSDLSHFSNTFARHMGETPSGYRRRSA